MTDTPSGNAAASATPPERGGGPAEELTYRLRQQELLAAFGLYAMQRRDLDALLTEASRVVSEGLQTDLCKALEWQREPDRLLVRAGVGWAEGVVGRATLGADLASPAGYALKTGRPVISNHLQAETRFRTPQLLVEHGVKRAINVLIPNGGLPYGVLEADSPEEGAFTRHDIAFMQGIAHLLGGAVDRAKADRAADFERRRLRAVLDALPVGVFIADRSGRIQEANGPAATIWGGSPPLAGGVADYGAYEGRWPDTGEAIGAADWALARALRQGATSVGEVIDITRFDGSGGTILNSAAPVHDATGQIAGGVAVVQDITATRRLQRELEQALAYQTILTQEIGHRVKNSLAIVAGLLELQARAAAMTSARDALAAAEGRVRAVAALYDQLWRQQDVRHVELSGFLGTLCARLEASAAGYRIVFAGAPATVSPDQAIPLALLVNEVVTNAIKHAYPDGTGKVRVSLSLPSPERIRLEVSDRGVGLPEGFSLNQAASGGSLGMRMLSGLARQLGGELQIASANPGTRIVLAFARAG